MNKKTILIIIDDLTRGGAETLLVGLLPELSAVYNLVLVTLSDKNEFPENELKHATRYSLGFRNKLSYAGCVIKLRQLIKKINPNLVHAHLLNSSIIARMSCPGKIPFVYSVHSMLSLNAFNESFNYRTLEKLVFRKYHYLIAVSFEVLKDYEESIGRPTHTFILKNFVSDAFFGNNRNIEDGAGTGMRMVAVGNIKAVKNYEYLLGVLKEIDAPGVTLDIYGRGESGYVDSLKQFVSKHNLPVSFKGASDSISRIMPMYDLFVMSSKNEGFGLAAAEAMALGLPALLSDIPILREVTQGNALFFDLNDKTSLATLLKEIASGKYDLKQLSRNGEKVAREHYSKSGYLQKLQGIYSEVLGMN